MNKTKIDWTDYTWNPVTGCLHNCNYCYARKIAMRFTGHFKPTFHKDRLNDKFPKKPSKIFVCSMADLFGDWVAAYWVHSILKVVRENPQHIFQFLTKNPKRYSEFDFPDNCWLGITLTGENKKDKSIDQYVKSYKELCDCATLEYKSGGDYKFISIEPLLGSFKYIDIEYADLVIVGAMTGSGAIEPKKEWINSIKHKNIFYKSNIKKFLTK